MTDMVNITVVGKLPDDAFVKYANGYRGVDRMYIDYPVEFYETDHEILAINDEYEKLTEKDGYLHDLEFARKLRDIYNKEYPSVEREIIEVVFDGCEPELNGAFLGYDIADRDDSNILRLILGFATSNPDEYPMPFTKVLCLVSANLVWMLNDYQLFKTHQEATMALNLIEGTFGIFGKTSLHHKFEVVRVYLVE